MVNTKIYDLPESTSLDTNAVVPVVDFVGGLPVSRKVKASALGNGGSVPTKASAIDVANGTDDAKFVTAKSIKDSKNVPNVVPGTSGNVLQSDGTNWTSATLTGGGDMLLAGVQSVTGLKTFDKDKIATKGTSTGKTVISTANTSATDYTATLPAKDGTFAMTSDITGTNSNTNTGDQTITNTSDSTSHTVTLSASGGSIQFIEGSNITLTTGGTSSAATVTIAGAAGGGSSFWTAITATRVGNTSCTVVGDQTAIFKKGMVLRWKESTVDKMAMVSIPSTVSTNTTITFVGDIMASIDASSFKYMAMDAFIINFAYAGTIGATGTNIANAWYANEPYRVLGADLYTGTAGTTNATTIDINNNGTTMFTTKPTLASTVAASPTPFTADTTTALALNDKVTIDVDAVQTTAAIDLYVKLYLIPTRYLFIS